MAKKKRARPAAAPKHYPLREIAYDVEVSRFIAESDTREEVEIVEIREFIEDKPKGAWRTFKPGLTRFQTTSGFPVNVIAVEKGSFEIVISYEQRVPIKLLRFINRAPQARR